MRGTTRQPAAPLLTTCDRATGASLELFDRYGLSVEPKIAPIKLNGEQEFQRYRIRVVPLAMIEAAGGFGDADLDQLCETYRLRLPQDFEAAAWTVVDTYRMWGMDAGFTPSRPAGEPDEPYEWPWVQARRHGTPSP